MHVRNKGESLPHIPGSAVDFMYRLNFALKHFLIMYKFTLICVDSEKGRLEHTGPNFMALLTAEFCACDP